jgi:hypothetical protein
MKPYHLSISGMKYLDFQINPILKKKIMGGFGLSIKVQGSRGIKKIGKH